MKDRINIIKKLNKEIIKNILYKSDIVGSNKKIESTKVLKEYNIINKLKEDSINRINKVRLWISNKEYGYSNRIYKWNNNKIINEINKDKVVKDWIKYILNSKIKINENNKINKGSINAKGVLNNKTTIESSEPIFLHTNDKLNIYIRILIPVLSQLRKGVIKNNKIQSKYYNNIINKLLSNNLKILTILSKLYNKKVNIIPVFIRNTAGGMNEFIIGSNNVYSPYKYNITMNKLNKYIIPKSNISKNRYINRNTLYNIMYYNYINNLLNNNIESDILINNINTILPNINNRYITGYSIHYAGKLPKADSSARTMKRNTLIGTLHSSGGSINTISKTLYSYNNNGLASTKATIAQAPSNN